MRRNKGAITVYLSLIIVIIIAFTGGLIDASRMRAADAQVNRAVDNGTKSLLASYNADLNAQYGLFAFDANAGNNSGMVTDVVRDNLITDGGTDLYDYKLDGLNIGMKGPLTQPEVIKEQILQNMKYRAPINLMEGIIEKLSLFKDMNKYSDTLKKKEKLDQKVKAIDEKLKSLDEQGAEIQKLVKKIKQYDNESERGNVKYQFSDIKAFIHLSMILDAVKKFEDKKSPGNGVNQTDLRKIIDKGKSDSSTNIKNDVNKLKDDLEKFKKDANEAKEAIDGARDEYNQYKSSLGQLDSNGSVTNNGVGNSVGGINEGFQKEAKSYDAIFDESKSSLPENIKRVDSNLEAVKTILDQLEKYSKFKGTDYNENNVNDNIIGEIKQLVNKGKDYDSVISFYNTDNGMRNTKDILKIPNELTEIQKTISTAVGKLQELVEKQPSAVPEDPTSEDKKKAGEDLKNKKEESVDDKNNISDKSIAQYSGSLPSNGVSGEDFIKFEKNSGSAISGNSGSNIERSLNAMDVLSGLEGALSGLRDKVFLNEYVMTRLKDRVKGEGDLEKNRVPKMVDFDTQLDYEIEYILAGNHDDKSNSNNVWWKMYACRVLANAISIRGISDCTKYITDMALLTQGALAAFGIPSNLTILKAIYTAGWVASESKADLDLLVGGHKVPLYKKDFNHWLTHNVFDKDEKVVKRYDSKDAPTVDKLLSTVYSDYLRLFLLLQSQDTTLGRVEDIIQVNMKKSDPNFELSKAMTQVNVTGNASIKYMFFNLPIMFEGARKTGRYEIKIKKSLSF